MTIDLVLHYIISFNFWNFNITHIFKFEQVLIHMNLNYNKTETIIRVLRISRAQKFLALELWKVIFMISILISHFKFSFEFLIGTLNKNSKDS